MRTLDVMALPFNQTYVTDDGKSSLDLQEFLLKFKEGITALVSAGLVTLEAGSLGFAFAAPVWEHNDGPESLWDEPDEFVWFVNGWGDDKITLIANAVRKLRPLLRESVLTDTTLEMKELYSLHFKDVVGSVEEDGTYVWGDFPWGGAVVVQVCELIMYCAVSGATQVQDHAIAHLVSTLLAEQILDLEGRSLN